MAQKQFKLNRQIHEILAVIILLGIILFFVLTDWIFNYAGKYYFVPILLFSISLLFLISTIAWLVYQTIRKKRFIKVQEKTRETMDLGSSERNINDFRIHLNANRRDKALQETLREINNIKFKDDVVGQYCCISRSKFTTIGEVLQCPYCKSLFKEKYLTEWLMKNEICPVCRYKIVIRN